MTRDPKGQAAKFKELARQLGCDEDEEAFKAKLVKVARARLPGLLQVRELKVGVGYYPHRRPPSMARKTAAQCSTPAKKRKLG